MKKVIGFLLPTNNLKPNAIFYILRSAQNYKTYVIHNNDAHLCSAHASILQTMGKPNYHLLDNLCYFPDEQRTTECDAVIKLG